MAEASGKRINVEWATGLVGVQSRNLREQADLLARLVRPAADQAGDPADISVDQVTGEGSSGGANGDAVMMLFRDIRNATIRSIDLELSRAGKKGIVL